MGVFLLPGFEKDEKGGAHRASRGLVPPGAKSEPGSRKFPSSDEEIIRDRILLPEKY